MWLHFFLAAVALLFLGLFGRPRARLRVAAVRPSPPEPDYDAKETFRVSKLPPSTLHADLPGILSRCFGVDASTVVTRSLSRELPDSTSSPLTATITFTAKPAFFLSRGNFIGVESSRGLSRLSAQYHSEEDGRDYHVAIDQHFLGFTSMTPLEHQTRPSRENIDCIVLHDFGENAMAAFRDPKSEFLWIRDQLPQEFTDLDVTTYGYDCHFNDARSTSDHHDWANVLRYDLHDYRSRNKANDNMKPLIFVAHSLGGIIFKEVIISLSKSERLDEQKTVMCTHGALFFGVPSQGMNIKSLDAITKANPATNWTVAQLNQNIGDLLRKKRDEAFIKAYPYRESGIFQFYETKTTFAGKDAAGKDEFLLLVLPQSTMGRPWENNDSYRMNIEGDHGEIVKFERDSGQFRKVAGVLRGILKDANVVVRTRLMHAVPSLGTPSQLLRCDEWKKWSSANTIPRLLWVHGIPGAGKTVLTSFAIRQLESQHEAGNNAESDAAPVVFKLCFQRAAHVPKLVRRRHSKNNRPTVPELTESFRDVCGRFYLVFAVIYGLDESDSRDQFLRTIRSLVLDDSGSENLRLLVASRNEVDIRDEFDRLGSASAKISMTNDYVDEDIRRFIYNTILSNRSFMGRCGPGLCQRVETKLVRGAQGMFRWAWCQLDEITKLHTEGDIRDALERLPKTLDDTYERIINKIPEPTMEITRQVSKLLCSDAPLPASSMASPVWRAYAAP
ncbi:hypothetical protein MAPG_09005 [Magnaporthiopsis poae ATCC 64411]|uniref:Nephrocystin 3-like N-terminal domain-containing protein n=1 Tax=Magnaporthiopsis poae (strain ATCC 64411 / 73-15) TaxID=644358 RepID=A0A0C4E8T6_MAGP6|nr:hypothetical protein MAPG_09005 [Magnaporthiopsis poae ATCC 64411]